MVTDINVLHIIQNSVQSIMHSKSAIMTQGEGCGVIQYKLPYNTKYIVKEEGKD